MSKLNKKKLERKLKKHLKEEKFENAIKTANRLSKMFPDEAGYVLTKANCYEALGKRDEAVEEYKNALEVLGKEDIESYCFILYELIEMDMFEDALDVVEQGLKIDSNHKQLVLNKATLLLDLDRLDDFYEYIDGFPKTNEHWKDLQSINADLELDLGNDEKAIEICDEILEHEFDIDVFSKKINILTDLDLIEEAEELLDPLLNDEEYKNKAIAMKALLYGQEDENEEALDLLDDFLMENPESFETNMAKGLIHLNMENFEESEKYLRTAYTENSLDTEEDKDENEFHSYYSVDNEEYEEFKAIMDDVDLSLALLFYVFGAEEHGLKILDSIPEESKSYPVAQLMKEKITNDLRDNLGIDSDIGGFENPEDIVKAMGHDPRMHVEREEFQGTEAYDLIAQAWADENPRKSKQLAKKAIKIDKYAIDAYNVLAYHTLNDDLRNEYFKTAIDLFNETHDEEYFDEFTGYFWNYVETRPFMRAMQGYADGLYSQGEEDDAADLYEYMLELNPGDNQGVRYTYINSLLILNRLDEVLDVFDEYEDEESAHFLFSELLWAIKSKHDEKYLKQLYLEAIESNEHVVPFLLGNKKMPTDLPGYYSPGDSSEAVEYVREALQAWEHDKSALETLEYLDVTYRVKNK